MISIGYLWCWCSIHESSIFFDTQMITWGWHWSDRTVQLKIRLTSSEETTEINNNKKTHRTGKRKKRERVSISSTIYHLKKIFFLFMVISSVGRSISYASFVPSTFSNFHLNMNMNLLFWIHFNLYCSHILSINWCLLYESQMSMYCEVIIYSYVMCCYAWTSGVVCAMCYSILDGCCN